MISRRGILAAIATTLLGRVKWCLGADSSLAEGIARVGSRVYSEEGVPMFLACRNSSGIVTTPPTALNRKVALAFGRDAREWQYLHPDAPVSDVAKIMELLSDQDFAAGGTEASL